MDIEEAIRSRKSIRGFKTDPVPQEILKQVLEIAIHSPSAMNTQPWEITVVTGDTLDRIRKGNVELSRAGVEWHAETPHSPFQDKYRQRQVDLAIQLFKLMDIAREDKVKRAWWMERGYRVFDAPAAIILAMDKSLDQSAISVLDMGAIMQTICLAALKFGLGTCIEDQAVLYPEVIKKETGLAESKRIVICIAIGYPDWSFPANKVQSTREPLESKVRWLG